MVSLMASENITTLGQRIRQARDAKGWTQRELAFRVHRQPQSVSNWENDRAAPELETIPLLARELGQPLDWLIDDSTGTGLLREIRALREEIREALRVAHEAVERRDELLERVEPLLQAQLRVPRSARKSARSD